jgi:hypothetical protein
MVWDYAQRPGQKNETELTRSLGTRKHPQHKESQIRRLYYESDEGIDNGNGHDDIRNTEATLVTTRYEVVVRLTSATR